MACFGKEHLAIAATLGLNDLPLISIALIFLRSFAATAHVSFPRAFFPLCFFKFHFDKALAFKFPLLAMRITELDA